MCVLLCYFVFVDVGGLAMAMSHHDIAYDVREWRLFCVCFSAHLADVVRLEDR